HRPTERRPRTGRIVWYEWSTPLKRGYREGENHGLNEAGPILIVESLVGVVFRQQYSNGENLSLLANSCADYGFGQSALLQRHHLRRQRVLIGARLVVEALAEAPRSHLEVQRDRPVVGHDETARFGEDFAALLVVDRGERLIDERIERR